jgi:hypothetical protein
MIITHCARHDGGFEWGITPNGRFAEFAEIHAP